MNEGVSIFEDTISWSYITTVSIVAPEESYKAGNFQMRSF